MNPRLSFVHKFVEKQCRGDELVVSTVTPKKRHFCLTFQVLNVLVAVKFLHQKYVCLFFAGMNRARRRETLSQSAIFVSL